MPRMVYNKIGKITKEKVSGIMSRAKSILAGVLGVASIGTSVVTYQKYIKPRRNTVKSLQKLTDYSDGYNLYSINVDYNYDLDGVLAMNIGNDQAMMDSFIAKALPFVPIKAKPPKFGCTAFTMKDETTDALMGRSYDFANDTSACLVYCNPKGGLKSVATAALDNVGVRHPEDSRKQRLATLAAPFLCLDGMNEKGVSIAVLTLDSEPVHQKTNKVPLPTSLVIRLVLDRATSTEHAVSLIKQYDAFATCGRDYHFYITDSKGDGRVVEFDCDSPTRETTVTKTEAVTNFYVMHKDKVKPNQKNGIYGHGRERYDRACEILENNKGNYCNTTAWEILKSVAQDPSPHDITSNTQWSIVYNNSTLTAEIAIRRTWDSVFGYGLI